MSISTEFIFGTPWYFSLQQKLYASDQRCAGQIYGTNLKSICTISICLGEKSQERDREREREINTNERERERDQKKE